MALPTEPPPYTETAHSLALFADPVVEALFSPRAWLQRMLEVEAALARAAAKQGLIPAAAADAIAAHCDIRLIDADAVLGQTDLSGNPAIPLVKALTMQVAAAQPGAAAWVHWGATSQDIIDTATVLQARAAFARLIDGSSTLIATLRSLAERERDTPMVARTLLQQAVPTTFGFKAAGWLDALLRSHVRLRRAHREIAVLQFGGAAGTLASLGSDGPALAAGLAAELDLALPDIAWHGARDRLVEAASALALLTGALGKIARDVLLLMQSEVAEAREPAAPGKGGSSAMPHKRNPVGTLAASAAALRIPGLLATLFAALPQEHERGVGGWHAEWETLPEVFRLAAGSLRQMQGVVAGLELDRERMRANLDAAAGLSCAEAAAMALAPRVGRARAHALVEAAAAVALRERRHLMQVLLDDPPVRAHLSDAEIRALFAPGAGLGSHGHWIDRVLTRAKDLSRPDEEPPA